MQKLTGLTETPTAGGVSEEYFYRMLSPYALKLAAPYSDEESNALEQVLQGHDIKDMNFVAVGGGELWELRKATQYAKRYVCIEPLADIFMNDSVKYLVEQFDTVSYIPKRFSEVARTELPEGNALFMFLFNILSYIERPVEAINAILKQGDILFVTTWANTPEAREVRAEYFEYLNSEEKKVVIDPTKTIGLAELDNFPFEQLSSYKHHERIRGKITDILVIYT